MLKSKVCDFFFFKRLWALKNIFVDSPANVAETVNTKIIKWIWRAHRNSQVTSSEEYQITRTTCATVQESSQMSTSALAQEDSQTSTTTMAQEDSQMTFLGKSYTLKNVIPKIKIKTMELFIVLNPAELSFSNSTPEQPDNFVRKIICFEAWYSWNKNKTLEMLVVLNPAELSAASLH